MLSRFAVPELSEEILEQAKKKYSKKEEWEQDLRLRRIDLEALERFAGKYFTSENIVITTVGDIDHKRITEVVDKVLGELPRQGEKVLFEEPDKYPLANRKCGYRYNFFQSGQMTFRHCENAKYTRIHFEGRFPIDSREEITYHLALQILRDSLIRWQDCNIQYRTFVRPYIQIPPLRTSCNPASLSFVMPRVTNEYAECALSVLVHVLQCWGQEGEITQELLDKSKAMFAEDYYRKISGNEMMAAKENRKDYLTFGRVRGLQERIQAINDLGFEEIQAAAKRMASLRYTVTVHGPKPLPMPISF
jgi:hypothetical protein